MDPKRRSWKKYATLKLSRKALDRRVQKLERGTVAHARKFITSRVNRLANVKRHVAGWIGLVLLLVLASTAQLLIAQSQYRTRAFTADGSYAEGVLGPLETLNPLFAHSSAEKSAARLLFASLYHYDTMGYIKADVAESMTVNEAETEYTVRMKDGVTWSDGRSMTADDVVFTVGLLKHPRVKTTIAGWSHFNVKKVDDRTVTFILPAPYAPFVHALNFPILPKHVLQHVEPAALQEHQFGKQPVTSGPMAFRILQNVTVDGAKKVLHMNANPHYHRGAPMLDRFQLYIYASRDDIVGGLQKKEITGSSELTYASLPDAVKKHYLVSRHTVNNGVYALLNNDSEIVKSLAVRRALLLSIDRDKLRSQLDISSQPLHGPLIDQQFEKKSPHVMPDVAKAKALLDGDGWKVEGSTRQKQGKPLALSLVALRGSTHEKVAGFLANSWSQQLQVSVDVKIVDPTDTSQDVWQTILRPRSFDVFVHTLSTDGDPDVYAFWHSSEASLEGLNLANYRNKISDDALTGGRAKRQTALRATKYDAFLAQWHDDVPAIALYRPQVDYVHLPSARALDASHRLVDPADRYADIMYWSVHQDQVYKTP